MRTGYSKTLTRALAGLSLALTLFVSADTAQADFLGDVIAAIDASQALPYPLAPWRAAYNACVNTGDILNCMDMTAKAGGTDDKNTDQVFKIFSDIQNGDYTQLITDGGEAVACAAAKLLTGIPVCDILGGIVDGAKAIYNWFSGLFGGNSYTPNIGETHSPECDNWQHMLPNGQCSFCPLGQALIGPYNATNPPNGIHLDPLSQGDTCGFCPGPTQSVTQSDDKRCWTTTGSYHQTPNADGSGCNGGGYGNPPVCCPPGAVSPSSGVCAPACSPGQVWNDNSNSCKSCGDGATALYDKPGHGSAGKCMCDPFGSTVMDQNGNCVAACIVGTVKNANGVCVKACVPGLVYDKDSKSCITCSQGTVPYYYNGPNSSAGTCGVCYNGGIPQNGQCVCAAGSIMGPGPRPQCHQCEANTYQQDVYCRPCLDNQVSDPGSLNCHTLTCGLGMHAANHKCVSSFIGPALQQEQQSQQRSRMIGPAERGRGEAAPPECPPQSRWTGQVCIGPRGKMLCPADMRMMNGICAR